jgi:hypothetical protein
MKIVSLKALVIALAALAIGSVVVLSFNVTAAGDITVSGNTSAGENQTGWFFGRDRTTYTPYKFTSDAHSFGTGSLYAGPITNTNSGDQNDMPDNPPNNDKFIAEYFPDTLPVEKFKSFSYDYKIGPSGNVSQTNLFYLNVYATIDDSDEYYDCRFDYVVDSGSKDSFTKAVVLVNSSPTQVSKRGTRITSCPSILSAMPTGSHIRAFAINMGDTSGSDLGLDGYFDQVELVLLNADGTSDVTTFDFEAGPQSKADCQGKKWQVYGFRSQGQCIKYTEQGIDTR